MKKMNTLKDLDIDESTETVYRSLLVLADAPASQVAKHAQIKRTSAYHILERLTLLGLASTYRHRGTTRYIAEHPNKLKSYYEQKTLLAERILPELLALITSSAPRTKVRFFENRLSLRGFTEEALLAKEKIIYTIGSSKRLLETFGGRYGFGARRRKSGIMMKSLRFSCDEKSTRPELHQSRTLPDSLDMPGYIMIFDNTVGVILFDAKGQGFAVTSPSFALCMKSIFRSMWENARPSSR